MQTEKILHSRWLPWAIFAAGCLLFGLNLGARDFWTPDEGDFAQSAREMRESGDYLVPHLNGKPYSEKPPLFYWAILLFESAFGEPQELSARLPSVLSAAGVLVLVFWLGKRLYGARAGLLAAILLATSFRFRWNASYLQTDMLFSFFCLAALCLFWRAQEKEAPRFWKDLFPFYAALALATLTKGPLAAVIVFVPVLGLCFVERSLGLLRKIRPLLGLALVLLLVGWWYAAAGLQAGEGFLRGAIVREHLMRFLDSDSHNRPPHYYLLHVWPNLFPWSVFLPAALCWGWRRRRERGTLFLWIGFVGLFLFLSACSSKQGKYLLPFIPAAALLTAAYFDSERSSRFARAALDALGALFLFLGIAGLFVSFSQWLPDALLEELRRREIDSRFVIGSAPLAHGLLLAGFFCLWFRSRNPGFRALFLASGVVVVFLVLSHFYSRLNPLKSPRALMERTASRMTPDSQLVLYGGFRGVFVYYAGRTIPELSGEGAEEALFDCLGGSRPSFVLMPEAQWIRLRGRLDGIAVEVDREEFGSGKTVLVGNRAAQSLKAEK